MVRHIFAFLCRNLGGRDLNPFVDLNRVAIDDFAIELHGECQPERTFAGRGGTNNGNDGICGSEGAHARENTMRKRITAQMRARRARPPISCAREKRMAWDPFVVPTLFRQSARIDLCSCRVPARRNDSDE